MGYSDYRSTPIGNNNSVPDSCCHKYQKGCGKDVLVQSPADIQNQIFINGCLEILKEKLDEDVIPMMIVYAVVGVILALTELITVVLACAFIAQINRRINKNYAERVATVYGNDETDQLNHETPC